MNTSFLRIASAILVVLFAFVAIPWIGSFFSGKGSTATSLGENISVNLLSFTENAVNRVSIQQKDKEALVLEKTGGTWKVGSDAADVDKVQSLFQAFAALFPREMVSKNEDNFSRFGVTKETGIRLDIRDTSGASSVFYVGSTSDIPQEFFLRKDGIKNVYAVQGTLRDLLTKDASFWKKTSEEKTSGDTASSSSSAKIPSVTIPSKETGR